MLFTALLTVHLVGLVLGLGGATIGDLAILRSMARRLPCPTDLLRDLSYVIWAGLAVLTASGLALFAEKPSLYLHNSGFIAKLIMVAVLMANGVYLHGRLERFTLGPVTLLAGAVSTVSWYGALVVAMFKTEVHLALPVYLAVYVCFVVVTWIMYRSLHRHLSGRRSATDPDDPMTVRPTAPTETRVSV